MKGPSTVSSGIHFFPVLPGCPGPDEDARKTLGLRSLEVRMAGPPQSPSPLPTSPGARPASGAESPSGGTAAPRGPRPGAASCGRRGGGRRGEQPDPSGHPAVIPPCGPATPVALRFRSWPSFSPGRGAAVKAPSPPGWPCPPGGLKPRSGSPGLPLPRRFVQARGAGPPHHLLLPRAVKEGCKSPLEAGLPGVAGSGPPVLPGAPSGLLPTGWRAAGWPEAAPELPEKQSLPPKNLWVRGKGLLWGLTDPCPQSTPCPPPQRRSRPL